MISGRLSAAKAICFFVYPCSFGPLNLLDDNAGTFGRAGQKFISPKAEKAALYRRRSVQPTPEPERNVHQCGAGQETGGDEDKRKSPLFTEGVPFCYLFEDPVKAAIAWLQKQFDRRAWAHS